MLVVTLLGMTAVLAGLGVLLAYRERLSARLVQPTDLTHDLTHDLTRPDLPVDGLLRSVEEPHHRHGPAHLTSGLWAQRWDQLATRRVGGLTLTSWLQACALPRAYEPLSRDGGMTRIASWRLLATVARALLAGARGRRRQLLVVPSALPARLRAALGPARPCGQDGAVVTVPVFLARPLLAAGSAVVIPAVPAATVVDLATTLWRDAAGDGPHATLDGAYRTASALTSV